MNDDNDDELLFPEQLYNNAFALFQAYFRAIRTSDRFTMVRTSNTP